MEVLVDGVLQKNQHLELSGRNDENYKVIFPRGNLKKGIM